MVFGQEIYIQISPQNVQVGDIFDVNYEKEIKRGEIVKSDSFPQTYQALRSNSDKIYPDTIPLSIVFVEKDTCINIQGKWYWQRKVAYQCLDTGYLVLPPLEFTLNGKPEMSQAGLLRVDLVPEEEGNELYDIQEYFIELPEEPFDWNKWFKDWGILILAGLLLVTAIYFFWKANKNKPKPLPPSKSAEEIALLAIEVLKKKKSWTTGDIKPHFVELSIILRQFLSDKQQANYMELTSFEIVNQLKKNGCSAVEANQWIFLLNVSDMVKFAKSNVGEEHIEGMNEKAILLIKNHQVQ